MKTEVKHRLISWWCGALGEPCFWCGNSFGKHELAATVDHFFPLSRGGPGGQVNTVVAHKNCNNIRKDRMPTESDMRRFVRIHGQAARRCLIQFANHLQREIARSAREKAGA